MVEKANIKTAKLSTIGNQEIVPAKAREVISIPSPGSK
jgi:hypothetical protein